MLTRAAYVATMNGPILQDGALVHEHGRILDVGPAPALRKDHPNARVADLGDAVILPGLVNAHTHLELTALGQLPAQPSFVDWIFELRRRLLAVPDFDAFVRQSALAGIQQSLRFGVTAVGDITLNPHITRPRLAASPLAGVSFGEVLGMAGRRDQLQSRLNTALDTSHDRENFRAGIEPHAPYSLDLPGFAQCLAQAKSRSMPLATHLAETPDEAPFLANHTGPFRQLWDALGSWTDDVPTSPLSPIATMHALGLLDYSTLLAHVNYATDADLALLSAGQASVVYCPRTHHYFNHPPHRFTDMLAGNINVALGTDSNASSPDLNLLEDLRLLHRLHPEVPAITLFEMATTRGARALGMHDTVGRLAPGYRADFTAFAAHGPDPLGQTLESNLTPFTTFASGRFSLQLT